MPCAYTARPTCGCRAKRCRRGVAALFHAFRKVWQSVVAASQAISSVPSQPARDTNGLRNQQWDLGPSISYAVPKAGSQITLRKQPRHSHPEDDAVRGFKTFSREIQETMTRSLW